MSEGTLFDRILERITAEEDARWEEPSGWLPIWTTDSMTLSNGIFYGTLTHAETTTASRYLIESDPPVTIETWIRPPALPDRLLLLLEWQFTSKDGGRHGYVHPLKLSQVIELLVEEEG